MNESIIDGNSLYERLSEKAEIRELDYLARKFLSSSL